LWLRVSSALLTIHWGGGFFWSWSAAVNLRTGTNVGICERSVSMQAIVALFDPVAVHRRCGGAYRLRRHWNTSLSMTRVTCRGFPCIGTGATVTDAQGWGHVALLAVCVPRPVGRSQLSPAVSVRLDITESALCRLGSVPNRAKHWTFRDMRCVASARTWFARDRSAKCGVDNYPCDFISRCITLVMQASWNKTTFRLFPVL